ncbi:Uncharacterized membrane protein YcaP, DUF421 family [Paenibacillus sophorae]|uniref:DUF421 domain-containing protein n=1 Tax=Paenibacillus sophorae TaxID=1333845 RepID=A0A1H8PM56_9BACL|nr:DUF421 domain-containing protein [Paenibacillus sophorae]QWU16621.1 DUF421 domain-containing protein [Paenibacillus sophorae]SEO42797.1 Uncharacterized membrane protein YcaP, DUF421 family [Paenibacillus sophorae]
MDYEFITIKLVTGFIGLWIMTRLLGKKEISQLTPFDFVSAMMLSEIVGNTIYQEDTRYFELIYGLLLWGALSYVFEKVTQHAKRMRAPLEGSTSILICNGKIDMKEMKRNRLDFGQLRMMLRQKDVFALEEVAYAIFENNGSLSVMKKPDYETPSKKDLGMPHEEPFFAYSLVEEGDILENNLKKIGKDKEWLESGLRDKGCRDIKSLAFVEWSKDKGFFVMEG